MSVLNVTKRKPLQVQYQIYKKGEDLFYGDIDQKTLGCNEGDYVVKDELGQYEVFSEADFKFLFGEMYRGCEVSNTSHIWKVGAFEIKQALALEKPIKAYRSYYSRLLECHENKRMIELHNLKMTLGVKMQKTNSKSVKVIEKQNAQMKAYNEEQEELALKIEKIFDVETMKDNLFIATIIGSSFEEGYIRKDGKDLNVEEIEKWVKTAPNAIKETLNKYAQSLLGVSFDEIKN